jgi:hypothetical protein
MTRWRNLLNFGAVAAAIAGLSLIAIKNALGPILTFFHNVKFWPDPHSIKAATENEDEPFILTIWLDEAINRPSPAPSWRRPVRNVGITDRTAGAPGRSSPSW